MPLRIGLLRLPHLLADVVRSAFEPGDAEFDELPDAGAASSRDARTGSGHDVVIAGVQDRWEPDVVELKQSNPGLVVLGLHHDGRRTWLYQLLPYPRSLGELGPRELRARLLDEVRVAAT